MGNLVASPMPLCNPQQLREYIPPGQRLLALDVSKKHLGIAISDPDWRTALPVTTIKRDKWADDLAALAAVCAGRMVGGFVIGLPLNMDGSRGARVQSVQTFGSNLLKATEILGVKPYLTFWDERLSTHAAKLLLGKKMIAGYAADQMAAVIILNDFLNNNH